jgi:hypothetical protein
MQRQSQRILQSFRDQLAEKIARLFNVSLCTTETEIEVAPPRAPDVAIGKIFDHDWELVSALIPMVLVRGLVRKRFFEKVESEAFKNLSRLTSQWEEALVVAIRSTEKESLRRLEELVMTVRRILASETSARSEDIQIHLRQLQAEAEYLSTR